MAQLPTPVYRVYFDILPEEKLEIAEVFVIPERNVYYIDGEAFIYSAESNINEILTLEAADYLR